MLHSLPKVNREDKERTELRDKQWRKEMGEEYEKRIEQIMNKLSHTPSKSKSNSNNSRLLGVQKLIGKRRTNLLSSSSNVNVVEELSSSLSIQAPSCRPWDRDDLFRRVSTFKSMTWFAKPQVVSPLNCARRGWVNVDMDTITCASCGARLLFSTPSSWTRQQVEKAALVFSLKLESGHKLICPWVNNVCTKELAQFPIGSRASLIDDYKNRSFALSQLTALPVISPLAIDNMRCPELEQFFRDFLTSDYNLPIESSGTAIQGDVPESVSSYYQAQKLISLCGWEPHILPYIVDLKDGENKYIREANVKFTNGQKQKINLLTLCTEGNKDSSELQFDPSSVVFDCKLCGASVGLWAFFTVSQPVEYLRFVGLTEVNGKNISAHDEGREQEVTPTSKGFSIAGGPQPKTLNYSAAITLPVVGHSLRAQFLSEITPKDMSLQNINVAEKEMFSATESDLIAENRSEVTPIVSDGSVLIDSSDGGHLRFDVGALSCSKGIVEADSYEKGRPILQGEDKKLPSFLELRKFDPVMQHRHFCPWISANGKFAPGWKQTLTALQGMREPSNFSLDGVHSSSLVEVDDPIASVRKLFSSPPEKGTKVTDGS